MNYLVYEHIVGTPAHIDTELEEIEEFLADHNYTANVAEEFIKKWIPDRDRFGNKRRIYIYKLRER